ncbi:polyphosphate kinase 2 family protein [Apibacter muscae]|uniref:Polyphosphate kinase 2 family protein n=1 Tax=Apibacter muscae TaxID=2509004 RepID=A0A563DIV3_9FLAO|nr:polyphosphate kinase 2 family protein [Apibacter muscae]TWP29744.1 polyphosphate kinase 2 family protein [Apibacter muscae]
MEKKVLNKFLAKPKEKHKVADFSSNYTADITKEEAETLLQNNILEMRKLQDRLYAQDQHSVLLIFQAMDAAGKDGTIKHVMSGINPQGCQVFSFKQPSQEELDHDFLWRIHKAIPEKGRMGIFNRSHYEDVLITKVHPSILLGSKLPHIQSLEDVNEDFWNRRYKHINDFENYLVDNGTLILKFFLNVSKDEQKNRFLSRLEDETKNWKFSISDLKERAYWDDYMKVYSDLLTETSTEVAPWYVIPADNKWFMRYVVSQIICDKMRELNVQYPTLTQEDKENLEKAKLLLQEEEKNKEDKKDDKTKVKTASKDMKKDKKKAKKKN